MAKIIPITEHFHHQRDRRCYVEVRRRTRPMVCFVNVESVDRIIYYGDEQATLRINITTDTSTQPRNPPNPAGIAARR